MNNIEKLKEVETKINNLNEQLRKLNDEFMNNWHDEKLNEEIKEAKRELTKVDFEKRIILNNLYSIVIEKIEKEGFGIIKKYLNRNIGEKTIQKIEDEFNQIIEPLTSYTITIRHDYYSNVYNNIKEAKRFNFYCSKIGLDTSYYVEDNQLKCCYNMEKIEQIENVEEEAERLMNIYYDTHKKIKEIEEQMKQLHDEFIANYHKNTYTDKVSEFSRVLFFCSPYTD